ncbi:MAG: 16S rRNA (guanine(527)-N(7))-methyltransferase RsmG [Caldilineaceae bacterium]|nr:16S rRNA (guanine(527)-N(7))-methyltransferase RsmG [Caldilineaceae bacterium]
MTASTPLSPDAMSLLVTGAQEMGISLSPAQQVDFERYYHELAEWNQKFNLTSITDYEDVQAKHFLDSLAGLPILAEELNLPLTLKPGLRLVDVGTGAGFPGVPLKLAAPDIQLALMDGTGKKVRFLEQLTQALALADTSVIQGRAEELGRKEEYRAAFDVVTARAVASLNTLVEYLLPLVRLNGLALIYKGPSAPQEFVDARSAIQMLGGDTVRLAPLDVPFVEGRRFILLIRKVRATPSDYPRGQGLPRRRPLT